MQLDVLKWIQSFHSTFFDQLMLWVTKAGNEDFYLLFGPIFFWCIRIGLGVRLLIVLLGSFYANDLLKETFHTLRPAVAYPDQIRLPAGAAATAQDDLGTWQGAFPSGHAQHTLVFWTFVALWLRRPAVWVGAVVITLLIGFSRLYLGVHWPIDILGGWLIGLGFVGALVVVPPVIERLSPTTRERLLLGAVVLGVMVSLIDPSLYRAKMLGFWCGSLGSLVIQQRYLPFKVAAPVRIQLIKMVIGLAGVFALRALLKAALPLDAWAGWVRYMILGVWVVLGAPAIFRLLFGVPERSAGDGAALSATDQRTIGT